MTDTSRRFWSGFGWGLVGTFAMSVLMIIGQVMGVSPMPKPIPAAIVGKVLGPGTAMPLLVVLSVAAHFAYGGTWAGAFASVVRPVTLARGLALGLFLWILMQLVFFPLIGWGAFGVDAGAGIWFATLVLHLAYGATVGLAVDRQAHASRVGGGQTTRA